MTTALRHTWYMTVRHLRALFRQPAWVALTLIQPIIWILLYGQLFKSIVQIPGFGAGSYIDFLTPGIVVMTVLFSGGWAGMGLIWDLDNGVIDRFLVTPVSRGALIGGRLVQLGLVAVIQSAILVSLGLVLGARYPELLGLVVLVACSVLLGAAFASLSTGLAAVVRKEETVIAAVNFVILPLTFLSSVFMAQNLVPGWIQSVARFNPVNWAVVAGREALSASPDWGGRVRPRWLHAPVRDRVRVPRDPGVPRVPAIGLTSSREGGHLRLPMSDPIEAGRISGPLASAGKRFRGNLEHHPLRSTAVTTTNEQTGGGP